MRIEARRSDTGSPRRAYRFRRFPPSWGAEGFSSPCPGGVYEVNERMKADLVAEKYGRHASNLGALIADSLASELGVPAFIVDPVVVDELAPVSRYSGIPEIPRRSIFHALNQKAIAKKAAGSLGRQYAECTPGRRPHGRWNLDRDPRERDGRGREQRARRRRALCDRARRHRPRGGLDAVGSLPPARSPVPAAQAHRQGRARGISRHERLPRHREVGRRGRRPGQRRSATSSSTRCATRSPSRSRGSRRSRTDGWTEWCSPEGWHSPHGW